MRENTHVRVFGSVRAFGGKRSLMAFRMYQLVDMNELTTHLLEVIHSHLALTKAQTVSSPTAGCLVVSLRSVYCVFQMPKPKNAVPEFLIYNR